MSATCTSVIKIQKLLTVNKIKLCILQRMMILCSPCLKVHLLCDNKTHNMSLVSDSGEL